MHKIELSIDACGDKKCFLITADYLDKLPNIGRVTPRKCSNFYSSSRLVKINNPALPVLVAAYSITSTDLIPFQH